MRVCTERERKTTAGNKRHCDDEECEECRTADTSSLSLSMSNDVFQYFRGEPCPVRGGYISQHGVDLIAHKWDRATYGGGRIFHCNSIRDDLVGGWRHVQKGIYTRNWTVWVLSRRPDDRVSPEKKGKNQSGSRRQPSSRARKFRMRNDLSPKSCCWNWSQRDLSLWLACDGYR